MRLAKNLITMRLSHFLGNVIGDVLYFFFIRSLKNFCSSGLFQKKKHMGKREGIYLAYLYRRLIG